MKNYFKLDLDLKLLIPTRLSQNYTFFEFAIPKGLK